MADGIACAHQAAARAGAVSATRFGHVGSDRVRDGPVAWALLADYAAGSLPARTLVVPHHVIGKGSMVSEGADRITVRDATEADVPALTAMKGERSEVLRWSRCVHQAADVAHGGLGPLGEAGRQGIRLRIPAQPVARRFQLEPSPASSRAPRWWPR
jgi:hypothetical protein